MSRLGLRAIDNYRVRARLFGLLFLLTACRRESDDPVSVAKAFIELARAGKCKQAFSHYTAASQRNLQARSAKAKKHSPYVTEANEPYSLHCHVFADYVAKSATENPQSRRGDTAVVRVTMRTGSILPIPFFSDPIKETPVVFEMVRENGAWKVAAPYVETEDPHRHELEIGKFTVEWARHPPTRNRGYRVTGVLDASPEAIEAVFLDFEKWPRWMPGLIESRALTQPPTDERPRRRLIYGRYATAGDSIVMEYVFELSNSMRTADYEVRSFGASWRAVDHPQIAAGARRVTSWGADFSAQIDRLKGQGVRVDYGFSGRPDEWPPHLAAQIWNPQTAAHILAALEREARLRAVEAPR